MTWLSICLAMKIPNKKTKNSFVLFAMTYFILLSMGLTTPFPLVCCIKPYFQSNIAALMDS